MSIFNSLSIHNDVESSKLFLLNNLILVAFKLSHKINSGNTFKQENQKPWTTFNPGLVLINFRTTRPRSTKVDTLGSFKEIYRKYFLCSYRVEVDSPPGRPITNTKMWLAQSWWSKLYCFQLQSLCSQLKTIRLLFCIFLKQQSVPRWLLFSLSKTQPCSLIICQVETLKDIWEKEKLLWNHEPQSSVSSDVSISTKCLLDSVVTNLFSRKREKLIMEFL